MKNILILLLFLFLLSKAHAQVPQGIPYQATARNSSGAPLVSSTISVRFTIRDLAFSGLVLYSETHTVTTDTNGSFSLSVGQGTPVSGTFAGINWSTNAKFMQVELDPAGGSSFINMGAQQLMSVPYTLHTGSLKFTISSIGDTLYSGSGKYVIVPNISAANCTLSAGTITGSDTVTVTSTTALSNATAGGIWSSGNTSIATIGSTGIVTGLAVGTVVISYTVTKTCGTAIATKLLTVTPFAFVLGATYGGGKIFYFLQSGDLGYKAGEIHGLVVSSRDLVSLWGCYGTSIEVVGLPEEIGTGAANTIAILSSPCADISAAQICSDLVEGGYDDWYLPSRFELKKLAINRGYVGLNPPTVGYYWSSSEENAEFAHFIIMSAANDYLDEKYNYRYVRAIRSFSYPDAIIGTAIICVGNTTALSSATTGGVWTSSNTSVASINSSGLVSGLSSGTTTISYTASGTYGTGTITRIVTVNPLPNAGTITGTAAVTVGGTTTLSNTATGGVWSSSATGIATVGSTGIVTTIAPGTTTISYTVSNSCGTAVATRVVTVNVFVGTTFRGGKVAYILQSGDPGYIAGEVHGIIAAPTDQSTYIYWGCYSTTTMVGGTLTALGKGAANTVILDAVCGAGTAARTCANLVLNGYSDWYLPSRDELQKLYINRIAIGGFALGFYWSSSEANPSNAWNINFVTGVIGNISKGNSFFVRAIRAF